MLLIGWVGLGHKGYRNIDVKLSLLPWGCTMDVCSVCPRAAPSYSAGDSSAFADPDWKGVNAETFLCHSCREGMVFVVFREKFAACFLVRILKRLNFQPSSK